MLKPIFYTTELWKPEDQRLANAKKALALHFGGWRAQATSWMTGGKATSAARAACEASPVIWPRSRNRPPYTLSSTSCWLQRLVNAGVISASCSVSVRSTKMPSYSASRRTCSSSLVKPARLTVGTFCDFCDRKTFHTEKLRRGSPVKNLGASPEAFSGCGRRVSPQQAAEYYAVRLIKF